MAQFPEEQSAEGSFQRQEDAFREWVRDEPGARFAPEPDRYHLYVSYACPWAHRTIIMRSLLNLESAIGMTAVDPIRDEKGWRFSSAPNCGPDPVNGFSYLSEAYHRSDAGYRGRYTVPALWDRKEQRIVSNSDDDIMRMLNGAFRRFSPNQLDFYPPPLRPQIDRLNAAIYDTVNNGVYKAGFATSQSAYEEAIHPLFDTLDMMEARLGRSPYLLGQQLTETDWRLWVTLIRFDVVYYGHFKCNLRRIKDYPRLSEYLKRLYRIPSVAETVNLDHIKRHYYATHRDINPTGIVPAGPASLWD